MGFCFYLKHEHNCLDVSHCPHLGGAALGDRLRKELDQVKLELKLERQNEFATNKQKHFQFDTSYSGQVSRDVLGEHFTGTLVTDCYAGYEAHTAGAKQKGLACLARTAGDWQKLTTAGSRDFAFFEDIREFVQTGVAFIGC